MTGYTVTRDYYEKHVITSGVTPAPPTSSLVNGLQVAWNFQEASGNATDVVSGYVLAETNGTLGTAAGPGSGVPAARSFGDAPYFQMNSNADVQFGTGDWTWACWVYCTVTDTDTILSKYGGTSNEFVLDINSRTPRISLYPSGSLTYSSAVSINSWHALRCWYVKATHTVYLQVDGDAAQSSTSAAATLNNSNSPLQVGNFNTAGRPLAGRLAVVSKWNRVLTDAEWVEYKAGGVGKLAPFDTGLGATITLTSPVAYQVIQRSGTTGDISIAGSCSFAASDIEARFNGGAWADIATGAHGVFTGTLSGQAQGQGLLEVRAKASGNITSVENVGIGDVFIVAGQSNFSNRATNAQTWSHATLKATMYSNAYQWTLLADPFDGNSGQIDSVSDDGGLLTAGSIIPLLAQKYLDDIGLPCAFVPCAKGSSGIVAWQPGTNHVDRTTLYGSMNYRASLTGAKCVLFWQGETDAESAMNQATYNAALDSFANAVNADRGVKVVAAKLQNCTAIADANESTIRAAVAEAWGDNANVLTGPDLSGLTSDDGYHLQSNANLAAAATLWWNAIKTAFSW